MITGGLGFIGLWTARVLAKQGRRVRLLDNLSAQIHGAVPDLSAEPLLKEPLIEIIRGDVRDSRIWARTLDGVDCIVHLAAMTGTAQSMYEVATYTETNVGGTALMLDYLANQKHHITKLVLASSRSVYGEGAYRCATCGLVYPRMRSEAMFRARQWEPWCPTCRGAISVTATPEDAIKTPASIYAATKLAQEDLVRVASHALGIPAVIFRFQNVYGEGQSLRNPYTGILSIFCNQMRQGKTVHIYEDGQESRDFVHVSDIARAVVLGLLSDEGNGCTLNVGAGYPTSIASVALLLKERLGGESQLIVSGQYRVGDIRHGYADVNAVRAKLGFVPEVSLEQGLDRLVAWLRTQPVEPDRLGMATRELIAHGLMQEHIESQTTTN